jgi:hypothetical protein
VAEAPAVEQFARQHTSDVKVIGLGTQDDFAYAQRFREQTGVTHQLLWDESFDSWAELGVASQPSSILFAADGRKLRRWSGLFDADEVLRLVAASVDNDPVETRSDLADTDRFCRYATRFEAAQRQMEEVFMGSSDEVSAMADDVTFSANGMLQFSSPNQRPVLAPLARAAAALRLQLRNEDPTALKSSRVLSEYLKASSKVIDPVKLTCGIEVRIATLG